MPSMFPDDPIDLPLPDDATGTPDAGKRALNESKRLNTGANEIIRESAEVLGAVRSFREENHYTQKFRTIIRGTHRHA